MPSLLDPSRPSFEIPLPTADTQKAQMLNLFDPFENARAALRQYLQRS